jgi:hypothetical protein
MRKDLRWHPYTLQLLQELTPADHKSRVVFANNQLQLLAINPEFLDHLLFSDEAHFHLNGGVNRHNFRYWCAENPHWYAEEPLHSPRVTVWMGISHYGTIGPFFFTETINGQRYLAMLQQQVIPALQLFPSFEHLVFMQDGAPPHWARPVRQFLDNTFPMRWMGRGSPAYQWPPRSPDLTPMDFFLWGYLKSKVYTDNAFPNLDALKQRIVQECAVIPQLLVQRAIADYRRRLMECVTRRGRSVEKR